MTTALAATPLHPLSTYTPEKAEKIFALLEAGWSLNKICKEKKPEGIPNPQTIRRWVRTIPEFAEGYSLARKNQLEYLADEILDISEDDSRDQTPEGKPNGAAVQRDRLRVDTIKFLLVHLMPEKYGTLVKSEVTGKDGTPLVTTTPEQMEQIARWITFETSKPEK